ncbi:MAG: hypothetical protein ACR2PZ_16455 [Pseudomonadales bacterium]
MINRDESEMIAREQRNQQKPAAKAPHKVSTPEQFKAVPTDLSEPPEGDSGQAAASFRTLVSSRATRHAPSQ